MMGARTPFANQISHALSAVAIRPKFGFSWFGRPVIVFGPQLKGRVSSSGERELMVVALQFHLYRNFYTKGHAAPHPWLPIRGQSVSAMLPLIDRLSEANVAPPFWEPNWQVVSMTRDRAVVAKNAIAVDIHRDECLGPDSEPVDVGMRVKVLMPHEKRSPATGSYSAVWGGLFATDSDVIRTYWNISPEGAIELMRRVSEVFSSEQLPFALKALTDTSVTRCDAAVLYTRLADQTRVADLICPIYLDLCHCMDVGVPALTRQLAPGLAMAEEPREHLSFGLHRCGILADAIIGAQELGYRRAQERERFVQDRIEASGIDPATPYREHALDDAFNINWPPSLRRRGRERRVTGALADGDPRLLNVAYELGARICELALWSGPRCTWLGPLQTPTGSVEVSLGPDLYSGTAGIALFLVHLFAFRPTNRLAQTALAAIEQALATVDRLPGRARVGLFSGQVGVALAAAHVGLITGQPSILERARHLMEDCSQTGLEGLDEDLFSGLAGAIVGLLALGRILADESLTCVAARMGDALVARASKSPTGWSWRTVGQRRESHLTGFSHGASGIAYSMLELYSATSDRRYAEVAQQAFRFERQHFNEEACNWHDLRGISAARRGTESAPPCADAWCHGAPGIAIARIRATEFALDEQVRTEASVALRTTGVSVSRAVESPRQFSLCHGLAGNAEILRLGKRHLSSDDPFNQLPGVVARAGIERYASGNADWPCHVDGEQPVGLLVGLAGVGHFYLRMYSDRVPSMLNPSELSEVAVGLPPKEASSWH